MKFYVWSGKRKVVLLAENETDAAKKFLNFLQDKRIINSEKQVVIGQQIFVNECGFESGGKSLETKEVISK